MFTTNKKIITRFKVILYYFADRNLCFDIFDDYDFKGNFVKDKSLEKRVDEKQLEQETKNFIERVNKVNEVINKNFRAVFPDVTHPLPTKPGKIDPNKLAAKQYIEDFLIDMHSYYVDDENISWKALPVTTNYKELAKPYQKYIVKKYEYIQKNIIGKSLLELIEEGKVKELDITNAVLDFKFGSITLGNLSLSMNLDLNMNELSKYSEELPYLFENSVIDFYIDFYGDVYNEDELYVGEYFGPATKNELEVFIFKTQNGLNPEDVCHQRRFIGVISSINYNITADQIPTCSINCEGLSSYLKRLNIVKDRALMTFFEHYPFDLPQPGPTPAQDLYNYRTPDEIFENILSSVLYLTRYIDKEEFNNQIKSDIETLCSDSRFKEIDGLLFVNEYPDEINNKIPFGKKGISFYKREIINSLIDSTKDLDNPQIKRVTISYIITLLYFLVRTKYKNEILKTLDTSTKLDKEKANRLKNKVKFCDIVAVQEGDSYTIRAYTLQMRKGLNAFYNHFDTGEGILKNVSSLTFVMFTEEEPGILTCKLPRINLILKEKDDFLPIFKIDFSNIISISWNRNDFNLLSRQDYTPLMHLYPGEVFPFCWPFTDPMVLFRYGPKFAEKATNANASLFNLNYIAKFCAVSLNYKNASTRTLNLTVFNDGRRYCVGRTYFIPDPLDVTKSMGWIGNLQNIEYNYGINQVSTINLTFTFVRRIKIK